MKHTYIADKVTVEINSNLAFVKYRLPLGAHGVEVERTESNEFGAVLITTECDCDTRPDESRPEDYRSLILENL